MTEQQQHPSSSSNVPLLGTFPEGQYLFETWLADAVQAYRRASFASFGDAVSTGRERFLAQLVADKAAQWAWDQRGPEIQAAADAELEACCKWVKGTVVPYRSNELRAVRRPEPPSLKQRALNAHNRALCGSSLPGDSDIIRQALEALPDG